MTTRKKIVVIGAGPMGLACAYALLKAGHEVLVCEAGDRVGGMSASFNFEGLEIERYYHFICATDQPLFDALKELGLSDKLRWRETQMGFYYQGKLYDWGRPDKLLLFPHLGMISKLRYALHVMYAKGIKDWTALDREEASVWIRRWIGAKAYEVLWEPLFRLKFFEYAHNLSAAWIGTRIQRVAKSRKSLFTEELGYIEGGSEIVVKAYCARIEAMGGRIVINAPVTRVNTEGGKVVSLSAQGLEESCDAVVSTTPLKYVPRMVPDLTAPERERINAIENIGVVCAIFKLRQPLTKYFWMNINDAGMQVPGMIEYTNLNPLANNVVYVPFYMPKSHPKYSAPAETFINESREYMRRINPDFRDDWILAAHASRYEFAQTVCTPNFFAQLPGMVTSVKGFFMADTAYYYPEDRSIAESVKVGERLAQVTDENIR
jgi:protoporphyrinogen oxidase